MRTVLITGAASGIGLCTAQGLYSLGWRVLMLDVNSLVCQEAAGHISTLQGGAVQFFGCDLANAEDLKSAGVQLKQYLDLNCGGKLDAMILNAGAYLPRDGHKMFALHCLSCWQLFEQLLPCLKAVKGRVIFTGAPQHRKIHKAEPQELFKGTAGSKGYALTKLGVNWLALALKREHPELSIYVDDPEFVYTSLMTRHTNGIARRIHQIVRLFGISPNKAAGTFICLCQGEHPAKGFYYADRNHLDPSPLSLDEKKAAGFLQMLQEKKTP